MDKGIRCNKCHRQQKDSSRVFSLTQCLHVFCNLCADAVKERCSECNAIGISTITLEKPLQNSLLPYFGQLSNHLKQTCSAANLQQSQGFIISRRLKDVEVKYNTLKVEYMQVQSVMKDLIVAGRELENNAKDMHQQLLARRQSRERRAAIMPNIGTSHNKLTNSSSYSVQRREQQTTSMNQRTVNENPRSHGYLQRTMEREIFSHGSNYQPRIINMAKSSIIDGGNRSELQSYGRNSVTFTPHHYQPSAILSDDSAESPITPVQQIIRNRVPRSLNSSSNQSSSDGTPNTPNYSNNRSYNHPSNF